MAYSLLFATVTPTELASFLEAMDQPRSADSDLPQMTSVDLVITSHYHASAGTGKEELDRVIPELYDGGETLHPSLWHPWLPPRVFLPAQARAIARDFIRAWELTLPEIPVKEREWWEGDFLPVVNLLSTLDSSELALVSFMEQPQDKERAEKVWYPVFVDPELLYPY